MNAIKVLSQITASKPSRMRVEILLWKRRCQFASISWPDAWLPDVSPLHHRGTSGMLAP